MPPIIYISSYEYFLSLIANNGELNKRKVPRGCRGLFQYLQ